MPGRLPGECSLSELMGDLDLVLVEDIFPLEEREAKNDSSSIEDMVVAAVAVEFERCENFILSAVVVV